MTKITEDTPQTLRPYLFHGVDLTWGKADKEAKAACPFCDSSKFSVNIATGLYGCWACMGDTEKGGSNPRVFARKLLDLATEATTERDYSELAEERGLLESSTVEEWDLGISPLSGLWLAPGYNAEGKVTGVYQWVTNGKRRLWMPTPGLGHQMFGTLDKAKNNVYICEGIWDAMALWEVFGHTKLTDDDKLMRTGNRDRSILAVSDVIAVPSAHTFNENWAVLFEGKRVILMCHNDHPKPHPKREGVIIPSASYEGMKKLANVLTNSGTPPTEMHYLRWGSVDTDDQYDLERKSGFDVRDALTQGL